MIFWEMQSRRPLLGAGSQIRISRLPAIAGELTRAFFTRARFVHREGAAGYFLAVERGDGGIGAVRIGEGHEAEATGAAGFAIVENSNVGDGAMLREEIAQIVFSGLKREITYV